jgi:hypothetical protein
MISVNKAREIAGLNPITDCVVISELVEAAGVLSSEVKRLQAIIREAIDTVDCFEQEEGPEALHMILGACQCILYKSGLAQNTPVEP